MGNLDFSGLNKLGLYSAVVNGQVLTHIQDEVVYVNSEDDLALLSDFKAGSFAMTYGLDTIWQKKPNGTWQEITGGSGGGGGGGDQGMVIETTFNSSGYPYGWTTADDASAIATAYKAGKNIVVHLTYEGAEGFVESDAYVTMIGHQDGVDHGGSGDVPEQFMFAYYPTAVTSDNSYTTGLSNFNRVYVTESGKLFFDFYVD